MKTVAYFHADFKSLAIFAAEGFLKNAEFDGNCLSLLYSFALYKYVFIYI